MAVCLPPGLCLTPLSFLDEGYQVPSAALAEHELRRAIFLGYGRTGHRALRSRTRRSLLQIPPPASPVVLGTPALRPIWQRARALPPRSQEKVLERCRGEKSQETEEASLEASRMEASASASRLPRKFRSARDEDLPIGGQWKQGRSRHPAS